MPLIGHCRKRSFNCLSSTGHLKTVTISAGAMALSVFVTELRRRRSLGIALAYAVVGFACIEAVDLLFPRLRFSESSVALVTALVILGFPAALIVAWVRAPKPEGRARLSRVLPAGSALALSAMAVWLAIRILPLGASSAQAPDVRHEEEPPLVVMMDSSHPFRIYDEETIATGGTNADVVSDILLDLPIRRQREAIGPGWHRDEEIVGFRPDLIVIHYSGFRQEEQSGPRSRLKLFIEFFADSETRFLIYGRRKEPNLRAAMDELLLDLDEQHPGLLQRVDVFGLIDYGPPHWRDPVTATHLKLRVKEILELD